MGRVRGAAICSLPEGQHGPVPPARLYRLTDKETGNDYEAGLAALERILGVEASYLEWAIACDGLFESGRWRITRA